MKPRRTTRDKRSPWLAGSLVLHGLVLAGLWFTPVRQMIVNAGEAAKPERSHVTREQMREIVEQVRKSVAEQVKEELRRLEYNEDRMRDQLREKVDEYREREEEWAGEALPNSMEFTDPLTDAQQKALELAEQALEAVQQVEAQPENQERVREAQRKQMEVSEAQGEAQDALRAMERELDFLGEGFEDVKQAHREAMEAQQQAAEAQDRAQEMVKNVRSLEGSIPRLEDAVQRHRQNMERNRNRTGKSKEMLETRQQQVADAQQEVDERQQDVEEARKNVESSDGSEEAKNQLASAEAKLNQAREQLERNQGRERSAADAVEDYTSRADNAEQAMKETQENLKNAKQELAETRSQLVDAQQQVVAAQQQAVDKGSESKQKMAQAVSKSVAPTTAELPQETRDALADAPPTPEGGDLVELYQAAVDAEARIAELYRQQRAADTAVESRTPLTHALARTQSVAPDRPELDAETLRQAVESSSAGEAHRQEVNRLQEEMRDISATVQRLVSLSNQSGGLTAGVPVMQTSGSMSPEGSGGEYGSSPGASFLDQLREMAREDDAERYKDLSGMMRAAAGVGEARTLAPGMPSGSGTAARSPDLPPARRIGAPGRGQQGSGWVYLDSWYLIGPWDNPSRRHIDTMFPPESVIDLDGVYRDEAGNPLRWTFQNSPKVAVRPRDDRPYAIFYGYTEVWCERDMDLTLAVGSDDFSKVWVNGLPVWASARHQKAWRPDEGLRRVFFQRGINRILVRLENAQHGSSMSVMLNLDSSGGGGLSN